MNVYDTGNAVNSLQQTNAMINDLKSQLSTVPQPSLPTVNKEEHTEKVNGYNGALNIDLAPNSDRLVLDQNDPVVWFVFTDALGHKTVKGFDISEHKVITQEDLLRSIDQRLTRLEEAFRNGKSNNAANAKSTKSSYAGNDAGNRSNDKG